MKFYILFNRSSTTEHVENCLIDMFYSSFRWQCGDNASCGASKTSSIHTGSTQHPHCIDLHCIHRANVSHDSIVLSCLWALRVLTKTMLCRKHFAVNLQCPPVFLAFCWAEHWAVLRTMRKRSCCQKALLLSWQRCHLLCVKLHVHLTNPLWILVKFILSSP